MANKNLENAKKAKNDEFYTMLKDIEDEMSHYVEDLTGREIYCNCDDPHWSNFFKYFVLHFNELKLKKLSATCYKQEDGKAWKAVITKVPEEFLQNKYEDMLPFLFSMRENQLEELKGDGSFDSDECREILAEDNIVITNPPFSLFRKFFALLMEYNKKFIILGNTNAVTYKDIFPYIYRGELFAGYNFNKTVEFIANDSYPLTSKSAYVDDKGEKHIFIPCVSWFNNIKFLDKGFIDTSNNHYDPIKYPKYDNYDAIEVSKTKDIPCDYDGAMGVPITFFGKYNPEQFEILGKTTGVDQYNARKTKEYINAKQINKDGSVKVGTKINSSASMVKESDSGTYYIADNATQPLASMYTRILIENKNGGGIKNPGKEPLYINGRPKYARFVIKRRK